MCHSTAKLDFLICTKMLHWFCAICFTSKSVWITFNGTGTHTHKMLPTEHFLLLFSSEHHHCHQTKPMQSFIHTKYADTEQRNQFRTSYVQVYIFNWKKGCYQINYNIYIPSVKTKIQLVSRTTWKIIICSSIINHVKEFWNGTCTLHEHESCSQVVSNRFNSRRIQFALTATKLYNKLVLFAWLLIPVCLFRFTMTLPPHKEIEHLTHLPRAINHFHPV